jgi:hypothetical protein
MPGRDIAVLRGPVFMDEYGWVEPGRINATHFHGPVDLEGRPVAKTKTSNPHDYDGHVIWRGGRNDSINGCDYTDRLQQWDADKFSRCCKAHMDGVRWDNAPPEQVQAFLRDYHVDPGLRLIAIMEWCNQSSGYPVWSLHYKASEASP